MNDPFRGSLVLLKIIITTSMTSSEAERYYSTLKRMKSCLWVTIGEDKLNALVMRSIENKMIFNDVDFNKENIDMFSEINDKRIDFKYKNV